MTNGTVPGEDRPRGAKMAIEVYTVSRDGMVVGPPRATVSVPHGYEPALEPLNTQLAPCACPVHRQAGAR
ncbi:hypothetical protein StrepF001_44175 [Streptomyces sp. F001]|uniref:hypothetical protein n=1 Tax=Streptomyces sp. F001 TaxID=1510026 RepID=UPI00101E810B|nr:hypothetical protein [Streptomyces sp. F001]RZB13430.1 hypothetical protein StrepF001_44175 [Streptomyces sp. F001]